MGEAMTDHRHYEVYILWSGVLMEYSVPYDKEWSKKMEEMQTDG